MDLFLATKNHGKIAEYCHLLQGTPFQLRFADEFPVPEIDEPHETFEENALRKAKQALTFTGLPVLSDDSGICIERLGGKPGVRTARFAKENGGYPQVFSVIEKKLQGQASPAYFECALAFVLPQGGEWVFTAQVAGVVIFPPRGTLGLGYDPIFVPEGGNHTYGEIPMEEKHRDSHRGRAVKKFLDFLKQNDHLWKKH